MADSQERPSKRQKLSRLPDNYKIQKRPLIRPAIVSPYAGSQVEKVVYVSSKTPFMSAVKRVQKLLEQAEKRSTQSITAAVKGSKHKGPGKRGDSNGNIEAIAAKDAERRLRNDRAGGAGEDTDEVVLKATGKAIEKALGLGLFFQQREEYRVKIRTGSVGAIDDIVLKDEDPGGDGDGLDVMNPAAEKGDGDTTMNDAQSRTKVVADASSDPLPESRIRYASTIEVVVSLR